MKKIIRLALLVMTMIGFSLVSVVANALEEGGGAAEVHDGAYLKGQIVFKKLKGKGYMEEYAMNSRTPVGSYVNLGKHSNVNAKACFLYVLRVDYDAVSILTVCKEPESEDTWEAVEGFSLFDTYLTNNTDGTASTILYLMPIAIPGQEFGLAGGYLELSGKPGKAKITGDGIGIYFLEDNGIMLMRNGESDEEIWSGTAQTNFKEVKIDKVPEGVVDAVNDWACGDC
ncbi:MAG: hypothetical protein KAJ63_13670 [Methyloprofundus sp.]|nr:hypothetical protein [Methyloprofundus sp.]